MTNPFGITEVDIPGALGAYEAGQTSRVNRLLRTQQLQQAERQAERDAGLDQVIARVSGQSGKGAAGAYSTQPASEGATAPTAAPASPQPALAAPATGLPQLSQQDELALRLGGERGVAIANAIHGMNDQQRAQTAQRANAGLQVAVGLQRVPLAQRAQVFQENAPVLLSQGFTPQELQQLAAEGFSDDVLQRHAQSATLAARFAAPSYRNVDGEVIDERMLGTGQDPRVYAGQFIPTPQGLAERPGGRNFGAPEAAPPQVGEVRRGYRFNGGDPASPQSWTPEGAAPTATRTGSPDLDNWNNAGRAGPQGPRTFR